MTGCERNAPSVEDVALPWRIGLREGAREVKSDDFATIGPRQQGEKKHNLRGQSHDSCIGR